MFRRDGDGGSMDFGLGKKVRPCLPQCCTKHFSRRKNGILLAKVTISRCREAKDRCGLGSVSISSSLRKSIPAIKSGAISGRKKRADAPWVLYRRRNRRFPVNRELETVPDPAQQVPVIRSTFVHRCPPRQRCETFSSSRLSLSVCSIGLVWGRVCESTWKCNAKRRKWSNAEELSGCGESTLHFTYQEFLFLRHENVRIAIAFYVLISYYLTIREEMFLNMSSLDLVNVYT